MWKESTCAQGGRENILRSPFKDQNRSNQGKRYIGACVTLCVPCSSGTELSAIHWGWGRAPHGHGRPGRTSALQEQRWDTRKVALQAVVGWSRWGFAIAWAVERESQDVSAHQWQGRNWAMGRWHFSPFHLASSHLAGVQLLVWTTGCCTPLALCVLVRVFFFCEQRRKLCSALYNPYSDRSNLRLCRSLYLDTNCCSDWHLLLMGK